MAVVANSIRARVGGQKYSKRRSIPWGKIWPHGEFSLAWVKEPLEKTSFQDEYNYLKEAPAPHCNLGDSPLLDSSSESSQEDSPAEPKAKRKNGLKGITAFGRRMVQSGVTVMARKHGQGKLTFATLTVPPLDAEERAQLAESWGEVMRQLLQWVSRRLAEAQLPLEVVSVSEIQPTRLRRVGEGYLHAHLVWPNRLKHPSDFSVPIDELRAFWQSLIARIVNRSSLPNMQIRVETVKSNVAGYLAKYMSKGGEGLQQYREDVGDDGVPGQWWNMTKGARDATKAAVMSGGAVGEFLGEVVEYFRDFDAEWFPGRLRACQREFEGRVVTLAWYGYLKPGGMEELTGVLEFRLSEI